MSPVTPECVVRRRGALRSCRAGLGGGFLFAVALWSPLGVGSAEEASPEVAIRVEPGGIVNAPGEVVEADRSRHAVAELSGIAWLGGDAYAAVMDGSDRLLFLTVTPDVTAAAGVSAAPPTVTFERSLALDRLRDWEDLAIFTGPDGRRRWFFVEEDTPAVREFAVADGDRPVGVGPRSLRAVGMASLEGTFRSARANRGPEALALEPDGSRLWTANEEPLERDGPPVASGVAGKVRLVGLGIDDARVIGAESIERRREVIYEVDPPHDRVSLGGGPLYSGVVALAALGAGRLLVLERSAAAGVPPLENRIYLVDTSKAAEARDRKGNLAAVAPVAKTLLWKGALGVNLEGLCVGPRLPDGRLTLVAVADNGADDGVGRRPNPVACFFLTSPLTSP
jgi:hypothetical protein